MVHVRVDHEALVRGHLEPGEICEIPGIGPIPVAAARRLAADSILSVLVTNGTDVTTVAHAGRTIPASLKRALIERDPVCVVPGCDLRDGLEIDHVEPFALGGADQPGQPGQAVPLAPLPEDLPEPSAGPTRRWLAVGSTRSQPGRGPCPASFGMTSGDAPHRPEPGPVPF